MSEAVVHGLEVIEVEEHDTDLDAVAAAAGNGVVGPVEEERPVREPREAVMERLCLELLQLAAQRDRARDAIGDSLEERQVLLIERRVVCLHVEDPEELTALQERQADLALAGRAGGDEVGVAARVADELPDVTPDDSPDDASRAVELVHRLRVSDLGTQPEDPAVVHVDRQQLVAELIGEDLENVVEGDGGRARRGEQLTDLLDGLEGIGRPASIRGVRARRDHVGRCTVGSGQEPVRPADRAPGAVAVKPDVLVDGRGLALEAVVEVLPEGPSFVRVGREIREMTPDEIRRENSGQVLAGPIRADDASLAIEDDDEDAEGIERERVERGRLELEGSRALGQRPPGRRRSRARAAAGPRQDRRVVRDAGWICGRRPGRGQAKGSNLPSRHARSRGSSLRVRSGSRTPGCRWGAPPTDRIPQGPARL